MGIVLKDIVRDFPGTRAIDQVSCDFGFDEVHGLIGENGAGKSTLMNILAGSQLPSFGSLSIDGQVQRFTSSRDALVRGIALVSQEGSLAPNLSGAENILLGDEPRLLGVIRRGALRRRAEALMRQWFPCVEIDLDLSVDTLDMADRKLVEIVRALCRNIRLLILDEPTATLQAREKAILWTIIRDLPAKGVGVILVSHFLSEVKILSKRITVLRDGRCVGTFMADKLSEAGMVELMLKHGFAGNKTIGGAQATEQKAPILEVKDWQIGNVRVPAFKIHPGEIVGLIGLTGAGHFGFARSLYTGTGHSQGQMSFDSAPVSRPTPQRMQRLGMGFIPDHRMENALMAGATITENLALIHPEVGCKGGLLSPRREQREVRRIMERLNIRAYSSKQIVKTLSGGNKQKVSLGKWLYGAQERYRLLIFVEPTEGVDIGAKQEIYRYIRSFAESGVAVVIASSDLLEIEQLTHRVIVFVRGQPSRELHAKDYSEAGFIKAMAGEAA